METGRSDWSEKKRVFTAFLYEFLGSAIIAYAYNLGNQNQTVRCAAYMIGFLFAYHISGAHFNPATSLAVLLTERKIGEDLTYFLLVMLVQLCGCYAGIAISFLLAKNFNFYFLFPYKINDDLKHSMYFYSDGDIYFGRIGLQEFL